MEKIFLKIIIGIFIIIFLQNAFIIGYLIHIESRVNKSLNNSARAAWAAEDASSNAFGNVCRRCP